MLDLEPLVRGYCVKALDALLGRDEFDIIAEFGVEIPLRTIGFLFGIPEADQDVYRKTHRRRHQHRRHARSRSTSRRSTPSCPCSATTSSGDRRTPATT